MENEDIVWVAYTNTDCTEGRGWDVPIAVCKLHSTAVRLSRGSYVMGSDGPVKAFKLKEIDGQKYLSVSAVNIHKPTDEDIAAQKKMDKKIEVLQKAKDAGLSDEEIKILSSK